MFWFIPFHVPHEHIDSSTTCMLAPPNEESADACNYKANISGISPLSRKIVFGHRVSCVFLLNSIVQTATDFGNWQKP